MVNKNFIIFPLLLILDQITKAIIAITNASIDLKLLAITFVKNTGATWGLFQNSNTIFIWISIIALGILMQVYDKLPKKSLPFILSLGTGILGNLIDRIFRGYVVDFINFKIWPVFNFADIFITIGIIGMIICVLKEKSN
ncbi:MAG: signal peptidase II [Firmicutes bacterium]|nr:signal peptidase II [Bacillota bacterium]